MVHEGNINIVYQVKLMTSYYHYRLKDSQHHLDQITQTCTKFLLDYNNALDENNIITQDMYHLQGRSEDNKLRVIMLD